MNFRLKSYLIVCLGMASCLGAVFLASPRFWSEKQVLVMASDLANDRNADEAVDLLRIAGRGPRDRLARDAFNLRACETASEFLEKSKALIICEDAARGPKRMAQAQAWLLTAGLHLSRGDEDEAARYYKKILEVYWDHQQAVLARLELDRLHGE